MERGVGEASRRGIGIVQKVRVCFYDSLDKEGV
jgi:hypothetical protein